MYQLISFRECCSRCRFQPYMPASSSALWSTFSPPSNFISCLGHPSKFQRASRLAFVIAAKSLKSNFTRCLAVSWAGTPYIFGGSCSLTEFSPVQYSLYVQVLRSPILAALMHNTPVAGVSQTLRHGTWNGITELSQRAPPIFGWAAITLGIGPHSSVVLGLVSYAKRLAGKNVYETTYIVSSGT